MAYHSDTFSTDRVFCQSASFQLPGSRVRGSNPGANGRELSNMQLSAGQNARGWCTVGWDALNLEPGILQKGPLSSLLRPAVPLYHGYTRHGNTSRTK